METVSYKLPLRVSLSNCNTETYLKLSQYSVMIVHGLPQRKPVELVNTAGFGSPNDVGTFTKGQYAT